MTASNLLANRFREALLNGTFIANTNLKEQLTGTSYILANRRLGNLNTIALLAQHLHYYIKAVALVLQYAVLDAHDKESFKFPPITSQQQWDNFLGHFFADAENFANLVEQLPEATLDKIFVKEKYGTYRRNIDAMIEHCYYHFGQIVMLKKAFEKE